MSDLPEPLDEDMLTLRLVALGVAPATAGRLVQTRRDVVERQLGWWEARGGPGLRNPGGALRRAVEEDWAAPIRLKEKPR